MQERRRCRRPRVRCCLRRALSECQTLMPTVMATATATATAAVAAVAMAVLQRAAQATTTLLRLLLSLGRQRMLSLADQQLGDGLPAPVLRLRLHLLRTRNTALHGMRTLLLHSRCWRIWALLEPALAGAAQERGLAASRPALQALQAALFPRAWARQEQAAASTLTTPALRPAPAAAALGGRMRSRQGRDQGQHQDRQRLQHRQWRVRGGLLALWGRLRMQRAALWLQGPAAASRREPTKLQVAAVTVPVLPVRSLETVFENESEISMQKRTIATMMHRQLQLVVDRLTLVEAELPAQLQVRCRLRPHRGDTPLRLCRQRQRQLRGTMRAATEVATGATNMMMTTAATAMMAMMMVVVVEVLSTAELALPQFTEPRHRLQQPTDVSPKQTRCSAATSLRHATGIGTGIASMAPATATSTPWLAAGLLQRLFLPAALRALLAVATVAAAALAARGQLRCLPWVHPHQHPLLPRRCQCSR